MTQTLTWQRALLVDLVGALGLRLAWHLASGAGMYWDFVNFYNAGRRLAEGRWADLYAAADPLFDEPRLPDGVLTYVGFPISAIFFGPLGFFGPRLALLVFKASCAVAAAVGVGVVVRHLRDTAQEQWSSDTALLVLCAALLVWEPFWFALTVGGQGTVLAFPLFAAAFTLHAERRDVPAGVCLALALLLKPFLAPIGLLIVLARAWRLLGSVVVSGLTLALASVVLFGWPLHVQWMQAVMQESARWEMPWWITASLATPAITPWVEGMSSMRAVVPMPLLASRLALAIRLVAMAVVVLRAWTVFRRGDDRTTREQTLLLGLVLSLCASNVIWSHYLLFVLVPWLVLAARAPRLDRVGQVLVFLLLVSVARANFDLARWLQDVLPTDTWWGLAASAVAGSGTLILLVILAAQDRFSTPAADVSASGRT